MEQLSIYLSIWFKSSFLFFYIIFDMLLLSKYTKYTFVVINVWIWILIPTVLPTKKIDFRIFFLYFYLKTFNLLLAYLILCSSIHIVVDIVVVFQQNFHFFFFILIEINIETNWNKSNRHLYLLHLRLNLTTDKQTKNSKHDDDKKNNKSRKDMEKKFPFSPISATIFSMTFIIFKYNSFQHFRFSF